MNPEHAKRLFLALQDNINKYESQHGQIALGGEPKLDSLWVDSVEVQNHKSVWKTS